MSGHLQALLDQFRKQTPTVRDQGTSFEKLIIRYFEGEPYYQRFYKAVLPFAHWVDRYGMETGITRKTDTGIDLVAITRDGLFHAIQCKNYAPDYRIQKADIDSFFTASGKTCFKHRIIVATTNHWSNNAEDALHNQNPPVSVISLRNLENSSFDWSQYVDEAAPVQKPKKQLREHQQIALQNVIAGLQTADRGKLIMACGTGKTFTSLKIAEQLAGAGKRVLFLVPSLSLLEQALTEWTQESAIPLNSFAVCSDSSIGKKHDQDDDQLLTGISDLQYPATTDAASLCKQITACHTSDAMTVVFSTYHSIDVLNAAQQADDHPLPAFDLIICDEAHRTTGATFDGEEESPFVKVHNNAFIQGHKRLYMTATPRIYGETAKQTENVTLCSMDDAALYGQTLYTINFSEAVSRKLLVDYKVIVLAVEESHINRRLQKLLRDQGNTLKVDDAAKIVGCWKALSKQGLFAGNDALSQPMKSAVAFCQIIEKEYKGNTHKVSSKQIAEMFSAVVSQYQAAEIQALRADDPDAPLDPALFMKCEADHIDGTMHAGEKESRLAWLKAATDDNTCRILSNVRCLSEGVDVPSLDAVLFLTPRSSQIDVVQSVGRVMRLAPGKQLGYVILPVVIPAGVEPAEALDNNEAYKVVWQVLNALRAHDDRFDAMINKLEYNGSMPARMEVIAVADDLGRKGKPQSKEQQSAAKARSSSAIGSKPPVPQNRELSFEVGDIERALYARIVKKCGNRHHWEDWANDIAKIANTHIDRIQAILEDPNNAAEIKAFNAFAQELRNDLNNSISDAEIVEMLAQHLITGPVFDALFSQYDFAQHNPMSQSMQRVLDKLHEHHLDKERDTLKSFYESVKMRAADINSVEGKQRIVVELYDKFFRNAFPRMTERLGIVYTPVEVVDFILHSVEHVLRTEFGSSMADNHVHILDPFTGTGTFITRLLQSGIIPEDRLPYKYQHEIHANEIVLLAYYIAAINIESTYHGILAGHLHGEPDDTQTPEKPAVTYQPFKGICLTDTFQMAENDRTTNQLFSSGRLSGNSARRKRQKKLDIDVIIGNPPYSIGQNSANDNNANLEYPHLDERIRNTYSEHSTASTSKSLYDSYIRAIRWASDRISNAGVIGFVTNAGFIDSNSADGLRKCLAEEFSSIHIFHLRGNARTSGEQRRKEKDNIFDSGSRAPIAISLLVKNPQAAAHGCIYFHDIGDYLSREEKLERIRNFASIAGIKDWQTITPDQHGDWLNQRDDSFGEHIVLGSKKGEEQALFDNYSQGVLTARDSWAYNASRTKVSANMQRMIAFYNTEVSRFNQAYPELDTKTRQAVLNDFINTDPTKISWTRALKNDLAKNRSFEFEPDCLMPSLYRPYTKQQMYFNRTFNEMVYQMPRIFPDAVAENLVIQATGVGAKDFSVLISSTLPCFDTIEKGQCFPLYLYDETAQAQGLERRDAITDAGLQHFQDAYPDQQISKEDVFYYVYGLLHSPDYRNRFQHNLSKELPRIPLAETAKDFWAFAQAGRDLAHWHLHYESISPYPLTIETHYVESDADYRVEKMKFAKVKDAETGKSVDDLSTVIYNHKITIKDIPSEAWDYIVNGKPALQWVMERQCVKTDKASGIVNDANDYAVETMHNPKYPLELFCRVVRVSLETQKIVNSLPQLVIRKHAAETPLQKRA